MLISVAADRDLTLSAPTAIGLCLPQPCPATSHPAMSSSTTSAAVVPVTASSSSASPVNVAPASVLSLLRSFQSLQSTRAAAYARFKLAFRRFMDDRAAWEEEAARDAERSAQRSTHMVKEGDAAGKSGDAATLSSIREDNEAAARRAQPDPEKVFQQVCVEIMAEFQGVSKEVRAVIAALRAHAGEEDAAVAVTAVAVTLPSPPAAAIAARHFSGLLSSLQLLEKL